MFRLALDRREEMSAVVVSFSGGLGNQLFQYAAGTALSKRFNVPLLAETDFYRRSPNRHFLLHPFDPSLKIMNGLALYRQLGIPKLFWKDIFSDSKRLLSSPILFQEKHFEFDDRFEKLSSPVYLHGYWQSERYFIDYSSEIRRTLQLPVKESVTDLIPLINEESVCIHIRRGDYSQNKYIASIHGVCESDYYQRAISWITQQVSHPRYFIFTDDPSAISVLDGCVENPVMVHDYSQGDELAEFALMQKFRNFIIANSTFSWWGAYTSLRPDKQIVAPKNWFADNSKNTKDLIPASWLTC